ncbi:MAG: glutaredoxin [Actinomycetota bacterium]
MDATTTEITLIESAGCHLCADARAALDDIGTRYRLAIRSLEASSPEGVELVVRHRPALQPLVLVNGEPFSAGRLPRRKLERYLCGRGAEVAS